MKYITLLLFLCTITDNMLACGYDRDAVCGKFTAEELIQYMIDTDDDVDTAKAETIMKACPTIWTNSPVRTGIQQFTILKWAVSKNKQDLIPSIINNMKHIHEYNSSIDFKEGILLHLARNASEHVDPIGMSKFLHKLNFFDKIDKHNNSTYYIFARFCMKNDQRNNSVCITFQQFEQERKQKIQQVKEQASQERLNRMKTQLENIQ